MSNIPPWQKTEYEKSLKIILKEIEKLEKTGNTFNRGMAIGISRTLLILDGALNKDYYQEIYFKEME